MNTKCSEGCREAQWSKLAPFPETEHIHQVPGREPTPPTERPIPGADPMGGTRAQKWVCKKGHCSDLSATKTNTLSDQRGMTKALPSHRHTATQRSHSGGLLNGMKKGSECRTLYNRMTWILCVCMPVYVYIPIYTFMHGGQRETGSGEDDLQEYMPKR